jgi:hypothetical protein
LSIVSAIFLSIVSAVFFDVSVDGKFPEPGVVVNNLHFLTFDKAITGFSGITVLIPSFEMDKHSFIMFALLVLTVDNVNTFDNAEVKAFKYTANPMFVDGVEDTGDANAGVFVLVVIAHFRGQGYFDTWYSILEYYSPIWQKVFQLFPGVNPWTTPIEPN